MLRKAAAKSSRRRERHIRETPQPGQYHPVTAWNGQGMEKGVKSNKNAYPMPKSAAGISVFAICIARGFILGLRRVDKFIDLILNQCPGSDREYQLEDQVQYAAVA